MRLTTLAALALLSPSALSQDPVISEFLASNDNGIVDFEGDSSDWIEIHNPGSSVIDLGGWHLTDDPAARTKWTFPGTTFIAPGGFLIVFASSKDLTNPADELHTNFKLTSAGEFLGLYDPTASFASTSFDRAYPEQFEDVSYGFEFTPNITSNEYYFFTPTPGSQNVSPGPLLTEVSHFPELPSDNDDVVVTARLVGSLGATGFVQLDYRVMYNGAQSLQMLDDGVAPDAVAGDSIFTVAIPASASAPGEMLRWSLTALDANWNGTREPPFIDPERDPEYFGTIVEDPSIATSLRTYHWYVQNTAAANSTAGTRASLWFEGRFYDNVRCNARGGSSQTYPKKSYKFDFNPGERFFLEHLVDGEFAGAINRVPAETDSRSNMHVGGKPAKSELTARERDICAALGPELKDRGLIFVGIDVIGDYLTEINVTSPTGLQEINRFDGACLESMIWDAIEARR